LHAGVVVCIKLNIMTGTFEKCIILPLSDGI